MPECPLWRKADIATALIELAMAPKIRMIGYVD